MDGYLAAVGNSLIDGVYLKTVGGTQLVSAATAGQLLGIRNFTQNNPPSVGGSNVLTVQDTAAHIESNFATLNAHRTLVTSVVISANATITDSVLSDLQTLNATKGSGVSVTVRDTASTIIAAAPGQLAGSPSITPNVWALSASATVAEAGIAYLGALAGFSAGAFTLTSNATTNGVSVSDANVLGGMSSFRLGGNQLIVAGNVSQLGALTAGAQAIASLAITDSFANVAGLALGANFLAHTTIANVQITISDSATPTTAQVSSFLGLLAAGSNGGIPVANVNFNGHT